MDWKGNTNSVFKTLGASNHTDHKREEHDYYATDPKALILFLDKIKEDNITLSSNIWECACGAGHLSIALKERGYEVKSTDLIDRGYGESNVNFLTCTDTWSGDILTNPPYAFAAEFCETALKRVSNGNKVVMFLKIQFLEGQSRYEFFQKNPPKYIYVHSTRQVCALGGEFVKDGKKMSSATCYAWYIWEKGYTGDTVIRWIK